MRHRTRIDENIILEFRERLIELGETLDKAVGADRNRDVYIQSFLQQLSGFAEFVASPQTKGCLDTMFAELRGYAEGDVALQNIEIVERQLKEYVEFELNTVKLSDTSRRTIEHFVTRALACCDLSYGAHLDTAAVSKLVRNEGVEAIEQLRACTDLPRKKKKRMKRAHRTKIRRTRKVTRIRRIRRTHPDGPKNSIWRFALFSYGVAMAAADFAFAATSVFGAPLAAASMTLGTVSAGAAAFDTSKPIDSLAKRHGRNDETEENKNHSC